MTRKKILLIFILLFLGLHSDEKGIKIFDILFLNKANAQTECNGSECVSCTGTVADTAASGAVVLMPLFSADPETIPLTSGSFNFSAIPANSEVAGDNPSVISKIQIRADGYLAKDIPLNGNDPCKDLQDITLTKTDQTPGEPGVASSYTLTESNECLPAENGEFENQNECMVVLCDRVSNFPDEYSDEIKNSCTSYGQPLPTSTPPLQLCQTSGNSPENCNTALGRISTNPGEFVGSFLGILLSISGMIALYLIVRSGYQLMMSRGNPEAIQQARERLISAIVGLLLIIFSLVIMSVIGVDLLRIPGFGN